MGSRRHAPHAGDAMHPSSDQPNRFRKLSAPAFATFVSAGLAVFLPFLLPLVVLFAAILVGGVLVVCTDELLRELRRRDHE